MKKIVLSLFLFCTAIVGFSQVKLDYTAKPKAEAKGFSAKGLSAASAQFLYQLKQVEATADRSAKASASDKLQREYDLVQGKVSAIIELAPGKRSQDLAAYGVTVGSISGNMATVMIPVERFAELASSGICATLDVGEKQHLMMDNVRTNLGIDQIHAGMNLPQGYDGSGVVVGVIDIGFEYFHPSFYDTTGTTLRVKRVWNQKDSTGTAPGGYGYGSEYTTESQMLAAATDDTAQLHGTHVAGIAAGCGAPSGDGTAYKGIAPGADLVLVPVILESANIIDAIQYVHSYAQSVGKPCVINMSFGDIIGPHDGTGIDDRFVSSFVAQHPDSLVLVTSAGNAGNNKVHLVKQFSQEDSLLVTNVVNDLLQHDKGEMDFWGDRNFSVALTLVNTSTQAQVDFTGFFTTGADSSFVTNLLANDNDTLTCQFTLSGMDSLNQRYNAKVKIGRVPNGHKLILTVRCDTVATIHSWCSKVTYNETSLVDGTVNGDSQYTIDGFGANTDDVVSVGAYATRLSFTTYNGIFVASADEQEMGEIAYFSSLGPTFDGRTKPDIAAPGVNVVSSINRFCEPGLGIYVYDTVNWHGQLERYSAVSGTSMSSPAVTGVVALWMQHNPALGTDSVRAILHGTAHNDRFTGSRLDNPDNVWGYGKVNAYGGLPANTAMRLLNAFAAEDGTGCVEGGGVVADGLHTLTAMPGNNCVFVSWQDGNTDNPRTVNVICDTTIVAVFSHLDYDDCDTITDFPWTAGFDENLTCWKLIDADGDGKNWAKMPTAVTSILVGPTAMNLDNWLVSPAVAVNQRLKAVVSTYCINAVGSQDCSLLLSTSGSEKEDFSTVLDTYTFTTSENKVFSVSLDAFQGQTVRIAIRHHNITNILATLSLEDFTIEVEQDSVSVPQYAEMAGYRVATSGLQINISGAEGRALEIYDLTGRLVVNKPDADGYHRMPSSGVYILRVDGFKPRKVMVMQ